MADRKASRFVIQGEWTGYVSSQRKVAHRQVYPASRKALRLWATKAGAIRFSDGTSLVITVRDAAPRERVEEVRGYSSLIEDCAHYGATSVAEVQAARAARRDIHAKDAHG